MQGGTKNPPWARSNVASNNMAAMNNQMMDPNAAMAMGQQGIMPFQQAPVYNPGMMQAQTGMGMPMGNQMPMNQMGQNQMYPSNVVAYPTPRAMNPMYQNQTASQNAGNQQNRVFTGTVTKTHNDFGFVDHDVFYQTAVCAKGIIPSVNDRVLVEATFNPNMPFKWNATRIQVLPKTSVPPSKGSGYNAVPPPNNSASQKDRFSSGNRRSITRRDDRRSPPPRREEPRKRVRSRTRSPVPARSPPKRRKESPVKKRASPPPKYMVRVPRIPLDVREADVITLTQRYNNLYIPSDFFNAHIKWASAFPPQSPFSLNNPVSFHLMPKEVENPTPNDAVLEPSDADYKYSAKVMLISMPTLETLYQKCGLTSKPLEKKGAKISLHPTRLIKFLVGHKSKGGNFAIGGPWSPSLDGENPDKDPSVLIKTAIRTCKALTGVDLSSCTQWYRMVEFYYWREGAGEARSRLETVVLFLPDVWSAAPSRIDWTCIQDHYKAACEAKLKTYEQKTEPEQEPATTAAADTSIIDQTLTDTANESNSNLNESQEENDAKDAENSNKEPTHWSQLDLKAIKVEQLREELGARGLNPKGLKSALITRLSKALKEEESKEKDNEKADETVENVEDKDKEEKIDEAAEKSKEKKDDKKEDKGKKDEDEKKDDKDKKKSERDAAKDAARIEQEKSTVKAHYEIPNNPHIIVHPSQTAKGGKFNCTIATLSLLLDYRLTDNKEHSFELFVFAEVFNEMLMRDFGFYIYKTLFTLPEKAIEEKDDKKKKDEKDEKKDEKDDKDKKEEKDKKDEKDDKDKKDDKGKKDVQKRHRRDSGSDNESEKGSRKSGGVDLPPDPYLLLALVYFDTGRCGYILKKNLQTLFMSLGLQLSRSQLNVVLDKVCVRENFSYKQLMDQLKSLAAGSTEVIQDLPLETAVPTTVPSHVAELEATIAKGNTHLLPVFKDPLSETDNKSSSSDEQQKDVSSTGVVVYKQRVVDVGATLAALERGKEARAKLERALADSQQQARVGTTRVRHELQDAQRRLQAARAKILTLTSNAKHFHVALKSISETTEEALKLKLDEDDDVIEVVNGPAVEEKKDAKKDIKTEKTESKTENLKKEEKPVVDTKPEETQPVEMDLDEK